MASRGDQLTRLSALVLIVMVVFLAGQVALAEAQKLGVATVYVHTKEAIGRNESKLCVE